MVQYVQKKGLPFLKTLLTSYSRNLYFLAIIYLEVDVEIEIERMVIWEFRSISMSISYVFLRLLRLLFSNNMKFWISFWRFETNRVARSEFMTTFLSTALEYIAAICCDATREESVFAESFAFLEFSEHRRELEGISSVKEYEDCIEKRTKSIYLKESVAVSGFLPCISSFVGS